MSEPVFETDQARKSFLLEYFHEPEATEWRGTGKLIKGSILFLLAASMLECRGFEDRLSCAFYLAVPGGILVLASLVGLSGALQSRRGLVQFAEKKDRRVELQLEQDLSGIQDYALATLGIDEDELKIEALVFPNPILWPLETLDDEYKLARFGADGSFRSGAYNVAVLAVGGQVLGVFHCELNFVLGTMLRTEAKEFRFTEISSIATLEEARVVSLPTGDRKTRIRGIEVVATSGESMRVVVEMPDLWQVPGYDGLPKESTEKALRAIRTAMRG